jgi:hypothetical protein
MYASMMGLIPKEWLQWISLTLSDGVSPEEVISDLIAQGLGASLAEKMVSLTIKSGKLSHSQNLASDLWLK